MPAQAVGVCHIELAFFPLISPLSLLSLLQYMQIYKSGQICPLLLLPEKALHIHDFFSWTTQSPLVFYPFCFSLDNYVTFTSIPNGHKSHLFLDNCVTFFYAHNIQVFLWNIPPYFELMLLLFPILVNDFVIQAMRKGVWTTTSLLNKLHIGQLRHLYNALSKRLPSYIIGQDGHF